MQLTKSRPTAAVAGLTALLVANAAFTQAAQYADTYSARDFTLQAVYDDSTKATTFKLQSSSGSSNFGWKGIGTGSSMSGSTMYIAWVNSDGSVTLSNRYSRNENEPSASTALALPAISRNTSATTSSGSGTTVIWTQSGFPTSSDKMNSVKMNWAMYSRGPSSSSPDASISQHSSTGRFSLDLTKAYDANSAQATTTTTSSAAGSGSNASGMTKRDMIVLAHLLVAIIAYLLIMPIGVFIGRFGRTTLNNWFGKHRAVQSFGILLAVVAMFLGFGTIWAEDGEGEHFGETHHKLGVFLTVVAVLQGILGQIGHKVFHAKRIRWQNYIHIVIGIVLLPMAVYNMQEGFPLWEWGAPNWASWILWAWLGLIGVIYILGMVFCIPRERRAARAAAINAEKIETPGEDNSMLMTHGNYSPPPQNAYDNRYGNAYNGSGATNAGYAHDYGYGQNQYAQQYTHDSTPRGAPLQQARYGYAA